MFWHNFRYLLKTLWRSKTLLFWVLAFPLLMATMFHLAFANIMDSVKFDPIKIAVVDDANYQQPSNQALRIALTSLGDRTDDQRLFDINYQSQTDAASALKDEKVDGYIMVKSDGTPKLTVRTNGTNQTIIQEALNEIIQGRAAVEQLAQAKLQELVTSGQAITADQAEAIYRQAVSQVLQEPGAKLRDQSSTKTDFSMIEYYSLIAMTCLQGGAMGAWLASRLMANMSAHGRRVSVSAAPRWILLVSGALVAWLSLLVVLAILYLYTIVGLGIDYGSNVGLIILMSLVGSITGIAMGVMVGVLVRANDQTKSGVMTAITLTGCFFAGMMGIQMKYIVDTKAPLLNLVNPAAMITDGFYALYTGAGGYGRYWFNLVSLLVLAVIFMAISGLTFRRQQYDSL